MSQPRTTVTLESTILDEGGGSMPPAIARHLDDPESLLVMVDGDERISRGEDGGGNDAPPADAPAVDSPPAEETPDGEDGGGNDAPPAERRGEDGGGNDAPPADAATVGADAAARR
jgi:hypothetical protein